MAQIERIPVDDGKVELWSVDHDTTVGISADPDRRFLGYEQPLHPSHAQAGGTREAICWSYGRTLGNIAIFSEDVLASLPGDRGRDVAIDCDIVEAGKMRNGAKRWWCRTHQAHWGTKVDIETAHASGTLRCSNYMQSMSFIVDPPAIRAEDHAEVGVWCSMPPALTSAGVVKPRRPGIHLHVREEIAGEKVIDRDVEALTVHYRAAGDLFAATKTSTVHITPPAAFEFVLALETGRRMGHVDCRVCGAPHLDLGDFGRVAHTKHLCGNCGRDNLWSTEPVAATPLKPLHDQFTAEPAFLDVDRTLNIDEHPGATFAAWASTPAVLWTSQRPQERGIHVHLGIDGNRLLDDTFGTVIYRGQELKRDDLLETMVANTIA